MKSNGQDYKGRDGQTAVQGNGNGARPPAKVSQNAPAPIQFIEHHKESFTELFSSREEAKRFLDAVKMELYKNKAMWNVKPASVYAAVKEAATLKLQPGLLGQAYLIPYKDVCQFQIGYKGYIDLCRRSGDLSAIAAGVVHQNDTFNCELGLDTVLEHSPYLGPEGRGEPIAYYAFAKTKDGERMVEIMTVAEIKAHRDLFSQSARAKRSSPWDTSFDEMAKKTVIKRLLKYMPLSIEDRRGVEADEQIVTQNDEGETVYYDTTEWEEVADDATEENTAPAQPEESDTKSEAGKGDAATPEKAPEKGKESEEDTRSPEEAEDELF